MPFERDSAFFASMSTDELGWLNAYNQAFPDASPPRSSPIDIPCRATDSPPMDSPVNDSLTLLRAKGMSRRRHHYQTSTKSSVAKSVHLKGPHTRSDNTGDPFSYHKPLHPNLRCLTKSTPTPDNVSTFASPRTSSPLSLSPSGKRGVGTRAHKPITMPVREHDESLPRSPKQEWIYRRPKTPPLSCSFASTSQVTLTSQARRPPISPPSRPIKRAHSAPSTPSTPESLPNTPFWSSVLHSRSRSRERGSTIPLPQLFTSPGNSSETNPSSSPVLAGSPTTSTSTSSTLSSSRLETPSPSNSISNSPASFRKYKPRHRDFSFDSTSSVGTLTGPLSSSPSKSILTRGSSEKAYRISTPVRKNSSATSCSSRSFGCKSVKFVEEPTVHYASIGYSGWGSEDIMEGDSEILGIEVDDMDIDMADSSLSGSQENSVISEMDVEISDHPDFDLSWAEHIERPTAPIPGAERTFDLLVTNFRRKTRSPTSSIISGPPISSPSRIPRPRISGPFSLGSQATAPLPPLPTPTFSPKGHSKSAKAPRTGISLRTAPSVESFRSTKSGGARSTRSLRSLRSLPGSIKSTISINSRGIKEWFKDRVMGVDVGVVG